MDKSDERLTARISLVVRPADLERWKKAAAKAQRTLSDWIRLTLNDEAPGGR